MKAMILNASPRKNWNTAQLLHAAQQGAAERLPAATFAYTIAKGCGRVKCDRRQQASPKGCKNDMLSRITYILHKS